MRKKLNEYIEAQTEVFNKAWAALATATATFKKAQAEVNRLNDYENVGVGDYISTTKGKGTVLHVLGPEDQRTLKVYVGAGETASIVLVRYWEFQEVLKRAKNV